MPSAAELESMLRPRWKWAAPVIARALSSRKDLPGYVDNRYTSAREMARDIVRSYGKTLASFGSKKSSTVPGTEGVPASKEQNNLPLDSVILDRGFKGEL